MKKWIASLVVGLVLAVPATASANSISAGSSDPVNLWVYGSNTWSQPGYWDLRNYWLPSTAVITAVKESWTLGAYYGMSSAYTKVALFNEQGEGYYMNSGFMNDKFNGQRVDQKWYTKYWVSNNLIGGRGYINAKLSIFWEDNATGLSGTSTLGANGSVTTDIRKQPIVKSTGLSKVLLEDAAPFQVQK